MSSDFHLDRKTGKPIKPFWMEGTTLLTATAIAVLIAATLAVVTYLA